LKAGQGGPERLILDGTIRMRGDAKLGGEKEEQHVTQRTAKGLFKKKERWRPQGRSGAVEETKEK